MMSFTCRCWSKTPLGKGGCTKTLRERYAAAFYTMRPLRERCYSAMDENVTEFEFKASNNEEYGIRDSAVYAMKSEVGHLPGLGLSGAASASTLPPLLGSGDDKNKLLGLQCLNFQV